MYVDIERYGTFRLQDDFLEPYRRRRVPWGFGELSRVTYQRTYSRNGEQWWQTCRRVIEGMITVQRVHCLSRKLPWDEAEADAIARRAYERLWCFKWTPPGRGLWIMGTRFVYERGGAALNNCGFVSTKDIDSDYASPFRWLFGMSMLGVGVGFDTQGRGRGEIRAPAREEGPHVVEDSREGWAEALSRLLSAYAGRGRLPASWDLSRLRPKGSRLESFGGTSSGPRPLRMMLDRLEGLYAGYAGRKPDSRLIVDTMNIIGACVVAGGIRRSAQVALGDPSDVQFLDLKQDEALVREYRWASNNSVVAEAGMEYREISRRTAVNGEPGYFWLDNARKRGRMKDPPGGDDEGAEGTNPCVEQTLWDRELCCLVETYPARHEDFEDYCRTLEVAYLYAKTVTLIPTHDDRTNDVMFRHRRIGCSMTGIVQAINRFGSRRFLSWCDEAYALVRALDERYASRFRVPRSIKTTSVKPSGTVSLLAGATPGVHWEYAPFYIRRMRVSDTHPLVEMCREAGYEVEPDHYADGSMVISFPVKLEHLRRRKSDVDIWEKVELAAQMQRCWSDNQVSCTVEFDPEKESGELGRVLESYEDRLKAVVFLPSTKHGYAQPPYEEIDERRYQEMVARLKKLRGRLGHEHEQEAQFCEGGVCDVEAPRWAG